LPCAHLAQHQLNSINVVIVIVNDDESSACGSSGTKVISSRSCSPSCITLIFSSQRSKVSGSAQKGLK